MKWHDLKDIDKIIQIKHPESTGCLHDIIRIDNDTKAPKTYSMEQENLLESNKEVQRVADMADDAI